MTLHKWELEAGVWQDGVRACVASVSFADAMLRDVLNVFDRSGCADDLEIIISPDGLENGLVT